MERETGIEPATNSLEGCDSTTELLPPLQVGAAPRNPRAPTRLSPGSPGRSSWPSRERRLVARGGFEPPKPLGRQIYSLLRLTAPQPRQLFIVAQRPVPSPASVLGCLPPKKSHKSQMVIQQKSMRQITCRTPLSECDLVTKMRPELEIEARLAFENPWSWRRDLNPRPADYKSAALPD